MADSRLNQYPTEFLLCRRGSLLGSHVYEFTDDNEKIHSHFRAGKTVKRWAKACERCGLTIYQGTNLRTGELLYSTSRYVEGYLIPMDGSGERVAASDVRQESAKRLL